ncbi:MAG: 4a-hydroxytetrahydrobiopterin dehydratase [Actinobacteria bacterium]|nr:4a-hydroxytetrahydrobiopterin dehydratase [Actinomycetota bacterium]
MRVRIWNLSKKGANYRPAPTTLTFAATAASTCSHRIKGLHRNDFIMAAKTDEQYQP